jgi:transcription elongation factor SPT5
LREIQVFTTDIQTASTSDISTRATLGEHGYKLHELITIVPNTVGVIVAMDADSVTILDTFGKTRQSKVQGIKERKNSSRAVSSDADGNPVGQGDLVRVIDGEFNVSLIFPTCAFLRETNFQIIFGKLKLL